MIDHDVSAALRAEALDAHLAALVAAEGLGAFYDFHVLGLPQSKRRDRRTGITPTAIAMTITHVERFPSRLDHYRSAKTCPCICVRHDVNLSRASNVAKTETLVLECAQEISRIRILSPDQF